MNEFMMLAVAAMAFLALGVVVQAPANDDATYAAKVVAKHCGLSFEQAAAHIASWAADKVAELVEHGRQGLLAHCHSLIAEQGLTLLNPLVPVAVKAVEQAADKAVEAVAASIETAAPAVAPLVAAAVPAVEAAVENVVDQVAKPKTAKKAAPVAAPVVAAVEPAAAVSEEPAA